jgi:hypothetical protein
MSRVWLKVVLPITRLIVHVIGHSWDDVPWQYLAGSSSWLAA